MVQKVESGLQWATRSNDCGLAAERLGVAGHSPYPRIGNILLGSRLMIYYGKNVRLKTGALSDSFGL